MSLKNKIILIKNQIKKDICDYHLANNTPFIEEGKVIEYLAKKYKVTKKDLIDVEFLLRRVNDLTLESNFEKGFFGYELFQMLKKFTF